jgi:hypothetical protein
MDPGGEQFDGLDMEAGLRSPRGADAEAPEFRLTAADVALLRSLGIDPTRRAPKRNPPPLHVSSPNQIKATLRPARTPSAHERR